jgi:predicted ATPase
VALFLQRAKQVRPDLVVDATDMSAIAEIATLLEGIPLAIELGAGRIAVMSPREFRDRLASGKGSEQVLARTREDGRHAAMPDSAPDRGDGTSTFSRV